VVRKVESESAVWCFGVPVSRDHRDVTDECAEMAMAPEWRRADWATP
jgi:hypothetical protein